METHYIMEMECGHSSTRRVRTISAKWQLRVRKSFSTSTSYLSPAVFVNPGPPIKILAPPPPPPIYLWKLRPWGGKGIPRKCQDFGSKSVRKMPGMSGIWGVDLEWTPWKETQKHRSTETQKHRSTETNKQIKQRNKQYFFYYSFFYRLQRTFFEHF